MSDEIVSLAEAAYPLVPITNGKGPAVNKDAVLRLFWLIQTLINGASEGVVRATTLAGLGSGTRVGQPGQVTAGADKGEYYWDGSSWIRTGDLIDPDALKGSIDSLRAPLVEGFQGKIIFDPDGLMGNVRTAYFPRVFYSKSAGTGVNLAALGAESTRFPGKGLTEVQWGDSGSQLIYIDVAANVIKSARFDSIPDTYDANVIPIACVWTGYVQHCPFDWVYAADQSGQMYLRAPLVLESGKVLTPGVVWQNEANSVATTPSDTYGTRLWDAAEITFPTANTPGQTLVFDAAALLRSESPWRIITYPLDPQNPYVWPLISSYGGNIVPIGEVSVIGDNVPGTVLPNLVVTGKTGVESATAIYGTSTPCDITDAALVALGFTRGFNDPTSYNPLYGAVLPDAVPGRWFFARFYLQSDKDNDFGTAQRANLRSSGNSQSVIAAATKVRQLSARAAEFIVWGQVPLPTVAADPIDRIICGVIGGTGRDIRVCGVQIGYGASGRAWVRRDDYPLANQALNERLRVLQSAIDVPTSVDLLYPKDMWLFSGRSIPLYPDQVIQQTSEGVGHELVLAWTDTANSNRPRVLASERMIDLDGNDLPASIKMYCRARAQSDRNIHKRQTINVHKALPTALNGKSPKVLMIGDSLTDYTGTVPGVKRKLTSLGATPTMLGTITCQETAEDSSRTGATALGEGRRSRRFSDYTYAETDILTPVAAGNEAAYLALSSDNRRTNNPFLRASTSDDSADLVRNGYVFDVAFYLSRFSFSTPDFIIINLGTNADVTWQETLDGIRILHTQARAAAPNAYIAFIANAMAFNAEGFTRHTANNVPLIKALLDYAVAAADGKLTVLPMFAHQSREAGFQFTISSTDSRGVATLNFNNTLHFVTEGVEQYAEVVAAWIACCGS